MSGVLWKVQERQVSPLWCSVSVLDAVLLARASTSSAQLLHMDRAIQLAAYVAGFWRAQHTLGSAVPRHSMRVCARCACARTTCALPHAWLCTNLDKCCPRAFKLGGPPKVTGSWWIQRWYATWGRVLAARRVHGFINL